LNSRTENTTPKDRPRDDRIKSEERQRSHYPYTLAQSTHYQLSQLPLQLHNKTKAVFLREAHTFSFNNASETGFAGRDTGADGGAIDVSGIFFVFLSKPISFLSLSLPPHSSRMAQLTYRAIY
jgi:hypothetical protein